KGVHVQPEWAFTFAGICSCCISSLSDTSSSGLLGFLCVRLEAEFADRRGREKPMAASWKQLLTLYPSGMALLSASDE
ncbi:hypothetical protein, partial [uncultured Marinobacter sp.]|uniref:hypothetical protein n=1 Tax=uncultured Marinobacter sp. TaxID=187379 RepID=UPI0030C84390